VARLLVLAFDPGGTGMKWEIGHVIDVKPDGHVWGAQEGLPKFWRIDITGGVTVADCEAYLAEVFTTNANGDPVKTKMRDRRLDYAGLPNPIKNALTNTGAYSVTKTAADSYIKKVT